MPATVLKHFVCLYLISVSTTLWGRYYYCPYLIDEKSLSCEMSQSGVNTREMPGWGLTPLLALELHIVHIRTCDGFMNRVPLKSLFSK